MTVQAGLGRCVFLETNFVALFSCKTALKKSVLLKAQYKSK